MVMNIALVDKAGEPDIARRVQEVLDRGAKKYPNTDRDSVFYLVRSHEDAVELFPKDDDLEPVIPFGYNRHKVAFSHEDPFTQERWSAVITGNLKQDPVLVDNLEAICAHEVAEVVIRDRERKWEMTDYLTRHGYPRTAQEIVGAIFELEADRAALEMGYAEQLKILREMAAGNLVSETRPSFESLLTLKMSIEFLGEHGYPNNKIGELDRVGYDNFGTEQVKALRNTGALLRAYLENTLLQATPGAQ